MNSFELAECFKKLIGAPWCKEPGGFINVFSLPGISLHSLESIRDEDKHTFLELIESLVIRSVERVINDLFTYIDFSLKGSEGVVCRGRVKLNREGLPIVKSAESALVSLSVLQSKFLVLHLFTLRFYSASEQKIRVRVTEKQTNSVLFEEVVTANIGENFIPVNKHFNPTAYNRELIVSYEPVDANEVLYYETTNEPCFSDCGCNSYILCCGENREAPTYGLGLEYTAECSLELFACHNALKFKGVLSYAFQIEYYLELIGSSRLNKFTTTKATDYERIYEDAKKMYENAYKRLKNSLYICDECCFKCNSGFIGMRYVTN
jgi:hypothetical protein